MANIDPLSYEFAFSNYVQMPPSYNSLYDVKSESSEQSAIPNVIDMNIRYPETCPQPKDNTIPPTIPTNPEEPLTQPTGVPPNVTQNPDEEIDTKENIQLLPEKPPRVRKRNNTKKKGKTSDYWVKKMQDKDFPFYGCTICDLSYVKIEELDQHVTIHKGRLTSYDIRVHNQKKRKQKKKELKKKKKAKKLGKGEVKKEEFALEDLDIKPEDGYIGIEKASEFTENGQTKPDIQAEQATDSVKNEDSTTKYGKTPDPRLHRLFKCFACQKQFSLSYYLKLHVRSHTDERPYICSVCGQSFITASKLGRHNKRIHLAIKFQCRICYRNFSRFEILQKHFDKAHVDQKLEGEPYDYNAILPYLKELEEQMMTKDEDKKLKTEDIWEVPMLMNSNLNSNSHSNLNSNSDLNSHSNSDLNMDTTDEKEWKIKDESKDLGDFVYGDNPFILKSEDTKDDMSAIENIMIEEKPLEEIKTEIEDRYDDGDTGDGGGESGRENNGSDSDYFPSNTWTCSPQLDIPPSPPARQKRLKKGKKKKTDFPAKCEFCDKIINTASYYTIHLRIHSGERPFKCYMCGRGFITSSKMNRHVLTHGELAGVAKAEDGKEDEEKVKVAEEDIKEDIKQDLTEDIKQDLPEDTLDFLNPPKKKRKRKNASKFALANPKGIPGRRKYTKREHACIVCNKRFLHLETLLVHKKSHEGQEIVLKCNFCLEVMENEQTLKIHEALHIGPKPYVCTICQRSYKKRETLVYHRKSHDPTKTEAKEYICDICSKSYNAQCKLQRHLVSHQVQQFVLRYECPVCAHMFHTKYHIQMHLTTHQKEGLILEENRSEILAMVLQNARKIPKQGGTKSSSLADLVPADERSRVCNICGQVFQHFYYLEEHLKSHGSKIAVEDDGKPEEKKHICTVCNKGFKLHYYLKLHSYTHTKEKPYICQQCGKGFITKGKLKRHLETHSGLKKYQCHVCYKFFTRPSYLRIHVRTIHGTQDYNFTVDKTYLGHHSV